MYFCSSSATIFQLLFSSFAAVWSSAAVAICCGREQQRLLGDLELATTDKDTDRDSDSDKDMLYRQSQ